MGDDVTKSEKERMVDRILMWLVYDTPNKPGEYIKKWCMRNERDKEVLASLSAEDFNHRIKE